MRFAALYPAARTTRLRTAVNAAFLALLAVGLLTAGGSARAATGLIDETTYESPTYGYEVAWDQPWEFFPDGTSSVDGIDSLSLLTFGGVLTISGSVSDLPAEEFARYFAEESPANTFEEFEVVGRGEEDGVFFVQVEGEMNDKSWVSYTEVREIAAEDGDAPLVLAVNLAVTEITFANSAATAIADVALDGEPVLVALELDGGDDRVDDDRDGAEQDDDTRERDDDDQGRPHAGRPDNDDDDDDHEDDDDRHN